MIPGKHKAKVIKAMFGHSSQKGTPQFEVEFLVGEDAQEEQISGFIYLTEAAMGIARKSLKAIGFDPDAQELDILVENPAIVAGRECEVVIIEEEGRDGEYRLKVAFINPLPGPADSNELKKLSKALRDVKGSKKPTTSKTSAPTAAKPGDTTVKQIERHFTNAGGTEAKAGDDIPF